MPLVLFSGSEPVEHAYHPCSCMCTGRCWRVEHLVVDHTWVTTSITTEVGEEGMHYLCPGLPCCTLTRVELPAQLWHSHSALACPVVSPSVLAEQF
jgi:hypothetical protein